MRSRADSAFGLALRAAYAVQFAEQIVHFALRHCGVPMYASFLGLARLELIAKSAFLGYCVTGMDCKLCGTCCVAPDISSIGKKLGERCVNLSADGLCAIYDERPAVCRHYRPDDICTMIAAPTLAERVSRYHALFGLDEG